MVHFGGSFWWFILGGSFWGFIFGSSFLVVHFGCAFRVPTRSAHFVLFVYMFGTFCVSDIFTCSAIFFSDEKHTAREKSMRTSPQHF